MQSWSRDRTPAMVTALAALLVGCAESGSSAAMPAVTERDSSGVSIVESDLTRLTERCEVGPEPRVVIGSATGDPAHELYGVYGATVLSDGRIALGNRGSQPLRFFDPSGEFLYSAGREGDGPGEFRRAFHLWRLPGDTIWVGDAGPLVFEVFSPTGAWIRDVRPLPVQPNPPQGSGVLADGRSILGVRDFSNRSPGFTPDLLHVLMHDPEGALLDTLEVAPYGRWGQLGDARSTFVYPWFEAVTETTARGDLWVIGHGSRPELRVFAMDGEPRLERILRWSGVDQTITDADLSAARAQIEAQYADADAAVRQAISDQLLSDRRPVAESMPVMSEVQLAANGETWVAEYAQPTRAELTDWLRFDTDGHFACRLTLPSAFTVYEFGPDYVLGHREAELGIEQVVLYEVRGARAR